MPYDVTCVGRCTVSRRQIFGIQIRYRSSARGAKRREKLELYLLHVLGHRYKLQLTNNGRQHSFPSELSMDAAIMLLMDAGKVGCLAAVVFHHLEIALYGTVLDCILFIMFYELLRSLALYSAATRVVTTGC